MSLLGVDYGANNIKFALLHKDGSIHYIGSLKRLGHQRLTDVLQDGLAIDVREALQRAEAVAVANSTTLLYRTHRDGLRGLVSELSEAFPSSALYLATAQFTLLSASHWNDVPVQRLIGTNFVGSAYYGSTLTKNGVVVDVGTSSTDVVGVVGSRPILLAREVDFFDRLASGELWLAGGVYTPCEYITSVVTWGNRQRPIFPGVLKMFHVLYHLNLMHDELMEMELGYHLTSFHADESIARAASRDIECIGAEDCRGIAQHILHAFRQHIVVMVDRVVEQLGIPNPEVVPLGLVGRIMAADIPYRMVQPPLDLGEPLSAYGIALLLWDEQFAIPVLKGAEV